MLRPLLAHLHAVLEDALSVAPLVAVPSSIILLVHGHRLLPALLRNAHAIAVEDALICRGASLYACVERGPIAEAVTPQRLPPIGPRTSFLVANEGPIALPQRRSDGPFVDVVEARDGCEVLPIGRTPPALLPRKIVPIFVRKGELSSRRSGGGIGAPSTLLWLGLVEGEA